MKINPKSISVFFWAICSALIVIFGFTDKDATPAVFIVGSAFIVGVGLLLFFSKQPKDEYRNK